MARFGKPHLLGFQDWVYCVIDLGRLGGRANLAELSRVYPVFMGVITSRYEGIPSLL